MPTITGVHHVCLTVRDLDVSSRWYLETLGFQPLIPWDTDDFERRLLGHPSGLFLALTRHRHGPTDEAYDPRRPGLDHLALGVASRDELDAWVARLDQLGVPHGGVQVTEATGFTLVAFTDPDGIQLELYLA